MLVLTRKESESIVIGNHVRITVERVSGSRVRLSIDAPDDIPIRRAEIMAPPAQVIRRRLSDDTAGEFVPGCVSAQV